MSPITKGSNGPVCFISDKISASDEQQLKDAHIDVVKWENVTSAGGGGIQCQNFIPGQIASSISISEWLDKHIQLKIETPPALFIEAVQNQLDK